MSRGVYVHGNAVVLQFSSRPALELYGVPILDFFRYSNVDFVMPSWNLFGARYGTEADFRASPAPSSRIKIVRVPADAASVAYAVALSQHGYGCDPIALVVDSLYRASAIPRMTFQSVAAMAKYFTKAGEVLFEGRASDFRKQEFRQRAA